MGEFWNSLERALDLSKNVSKPAKNDLGNSPLCNKYHKIQGSGQANPMPVGCIFIRLRLKALLPTAGMISIRFQLPPSLFEPQRDKMSR
jgi:hypothetical protein